MLCRARTSSGARFAAGCWVQSPRRRAPRCLALFVYDDAPIVVKRPLRSPMDPGLKKPP